MVLLALSGTALEHVPFFGRELLTDFGELVIEGLAEELFAEAVLIHPRGQAKDIQIIHDCCGQPQVEASTLALVVPSPHRGFGSCRGRGCDW